MGCASSKQARRDRSPHLPLPRSHSLPIHHHKPDTHHTVALTSTTYGTLKLDEQNRQVNGDVNGKETDTPNGITGRTWSDMINQKIMTKKPLPLRSSTPTVTPQNEPETINTWELMEGLEDTSPLHLIVNPVVDRSFSFHSFTRANEDFDTYVKVKPILPDSPKPLWFNNGDDPINPDFDPEIISTFRKAIEELSPKNPSGSPESDVDNRRGIVQARISDFQGKINQGLAKKGLGISKHVTEKGSTCPPGGEGKVVLYFTSLRGIRKTYEDCCQVRLILQGLGVRVDERDVSMHYGFREELSGVLGGSFGLPRLFVKGCYVGGAEEVRRLHDAGELGKMVDGCGLVEPGLCVACGGVRFVPCESCSGSCKVFDEEGGLGFLRCPDCNENGIVRCRLCSC